MNDLATIRRLHQHRDWVNRRLRNAARPLTDAQREEPFQIGAGSLMQTLAHLQAAETIWLSTIQGDQDPPSLFHFRFDSFAHLEATWDESEAAWADFLSSSTNQDLAKPITKKNSRTGETSTTPLLDVLLHVCTHAQYTTAQAINMLRQLGIPGNELPDVMLITMSRHENPRTS